MREVDDALDFMKDEFRKRMEACDERQREFEKKQLGMKEQVTRFEKFIQENDAKRKRAEKKRSEEAAKEAARLEVLGVDTEHSTMAAKGFRDVKWDVKDFNKMLDQLAGEAGKNGFSTKEIIEGEAATTLASAADLTEKADSKEIDKRYSLKRVPKSGKNKGKNPNTDPALIPFVKVNGKWYSTCQSRWYDRWVETSWNWESNAT